MPEIKHADSEVLLSPYPLRDLLLKKFFAPVAVPIFILVLCLCLCLCLCLPGLAGADEPTEQQTEQPTEEAELPQAFDRFFGHETVAEELKGSQLRVNVIGETSRKSPFSLDSNAHVNLQLPLLKKQLHLLMSGDSADDPLENNLQSEGAVGEQDVMHLEDDVEDSVALQYFLVAKRLWNVSFSPGVSFVIPPDPFLKVRGRRSFTLDHWELSIVQGGSWYVRRGFGSSTRFTADHPWGKERLVRATTGMSWSEAVGYMKLDAALSLFHFLPGTRDKALEYQIGIRGVDHPHLQTTEYHVSTSYRQNLGRPWLFGEVKGALLFPRKEDFHLTPSILFKLEGIFGDEYLPRRLREAEL
jgi:hypothetical protein